MVNYPIRVLRNVITLTLLVALFQACNKENHEIAEKALSNPLAVEQKSGSIQINEEERRLVLQNNPSVVDMTSIPPSAVQLIDYPKAKVTLGLRTSTTCAQVLSPTSLTATLQPGQSVSESKVACLDGAPPKGDVLFCFDLTGSMGGILNTVKTNSINIMNAVSGTISDSHFGLITHKDYAGSYNSCGYSSGYGGGSDFPYALNQSITSSTAAVQAAINPLSVGGGGDGPESYSRALFEAYSDAGIGWRTGSARIVVAFLDNIPHDCTVPGFGSTGWDPGRNGVLDGGGGGGDDIDMDAVIAQFAAKNIKLIVVDGSNSGSILNVWNVYSSATGGQAVPIGSGNIATLIADLIKESVSQVSSFTLEPDQAVYNTWLTSVSPASYTNVMLDAPQTLNFGITFTVPLGTPNGTYSFKLNLVGDGAVYGSQTVTIKVNSDSDGDGCADSVDPHPNSNTTPTVIIDGCNSGVPNVFVTSCSTMSDLIGDCAAKAKNHGQFVSCVSDLTNAWKTAGLITGAQKGAIMSCAGSSNIPN